MQNPVITSRTIDTLDADLINTKETITVKIIQDDEVHGGVVIIDGNTFDARDFISLSNLVQHLIGS